MAFSEGTQVPQGVSRPVDRWVADIPKNSREVIRVELSEYRGVDLLNIRVWFDAGRGETRPGKAGIAIRVSALPQLRAAIDLAIAAARAEGTL